jgi:pimeloyl-ACP methyl ester carboxylesterase
MLGGRNMARLITNLFAAFAFAAFPLIACATPQPTTTSPPVTAPDEEVAIDGGHGQLHGSWLAPQHWRDGKVVLMIAGSGPTDRDGNSTIPGVHPNTYKMIAEALAASGIASLRFDKRGIGASAGAMTGEADLRFDTYVDDAVAWANFAWGRPHVRCVYILGHSEGAEVAALAAAHVRACGVISVSGAGRDIGDVIIRQITAQGAGPEAIAQIQHNIDELRAGRTITDVPPQLLSLFRPSVQPYMISWLQKNPVAALGAVKAPVLILQGSTDSQVSVVDANLLNAGHPGAQLTILDGVNHVLKTAPADRAQNVATYGDPMLPLAPSVMAPILAFIAAHHTPVQ